MPSAFHEFVAAGINTDITDWFKDVREGRVCTDERTIATAERMSATLATTVKFSKEDGGDRKDPDLSFEIEHPSCEFPGLVVEVAWSQRNLDLPRLAKRYIEETNGNIRTVVGLNLNDIYRSRRNEGAGPGHATFSVWQAELYSVSGMARVIKAVEDEVLLLPVSQTTYCTQFWWDGQKFRDEDGNAVRKCALRLSLRDFICDNVASKIGPFENPELIISSGKLCQHFEKALRKHQKAEAKKKKANEDKASEDKASNDEANAAYSAAWRMRKRIGFHPVCGMNGQAIFGRKGRAIWSRDPRIKKE
jgi:hypothetical protein